MRAAALLLLLPLASCATSASDPTDRLLARLALTDVVLEGAFAQDCFFSRYTNGRRFTARNARGETVRGVVCWGRGRSTALQLDGR